MCGNSTITDEALSFFLFYSTVQYVLYSYKLLCKKPSSSVCGGSILMTCSCPMSRIACLSSAQSGKIRRMTFSSHRPKFTVIFFVICSRQSISIVLQPIRHRTTRIAAPVWWLSKDFSERRKPAQILDFGIFLFPHLLLKMFPIKWTFAGHLRVSILQVYFLESRCRFNSLQNTNS